MVAIEDTLHIAITIDLIAVLETMPARITNTNIGFEILLQGVIGGSTMEYGSSDA
jgi:hypothetical protein